jgi:16S rRNA (cytidine1402-2'-O)-methyltransferase
MTGKLFLVGTPIGNLKDITLRALETLKNCDIIAAEDTRQTLKLLNRYEIKKKLISYHKFNENEKSEDIIKLIEEGNNIALVTDAGMPGISDPGSVIVKQCIQKEICFEIIPGATALITGLVYSGLDTTGFTFKGFLPKENKDKKEVINEIKNLKSTIIFYEAPHRLNKTLQFLFENIGNRKVAICKELTKLHENIKRTTLVEAIEFYSENEPRGEYVIALSGKTDEEIQIESMELWKDISVEEHILMYINQGKAKKEAVKLVAKDRKLSKNEVYKFSLNI